MNPLFSFQFKLIYVELKMSDTDYDEEAIYTYGENSIEYIQETEECLICLQIKNTFYQCFVCNKKICKECVENIRNQKCAFCRTYFKRNDMNFFIMNECGEDIQRLLLQETSLEQIINWFQFAVLNYQEKYIFVDYLKEKLHTFEISENQGTRLLSLCITCEETGFLETLAPYCSTKHLAQALLPRNKTLFEKLVDLVDINMVNSNKENILFEVATGRNADDNLVYLLKYNINVCQKNKDGMTPLMKCIQWKSLNMQNIIGLLLKQVDAGLFEHQDRSGNTLMHYSSHINSIFFLELLIKIGFTINLQNDKGQTPLHCFIEKRRFYHMYCILSHPTTDTTIRDALGRCALEFACQRPLYDSNNFEQEDYNMVYLLLEKKGGNPFTLKRVLNNHLISPYIKTLLEDYMNLSLSYQMR